jgi:GntR family transcriptional repressor for pyruvate dehydrogenase complex
MCEIINHLLRHLVTTGDQPSDPTYQKLGDTNVAAHRKLLAAARRGDAAKVRKLMLDHIDEAGGFALKLDAGVRRHFVRDSELQARITPREKAR